MTSSHSKRNRLIVILAVFGLSFFIVLVAVGLVAFEYWWRGTPEYSLIQIGKATETHDIHLFRKHVDLRSIANRMMDDLFIEQQRQAQSNAFGQGVLEVFRPRLLQSFEAQVERFVETGQLNDDKTTEDFGLTNLRERFGQIGPISFTNIDGNSAVVGLTVTPPNTPNSVVLPLKMRRTGDGYWQLTEIDLSNIRRSPANIGRQ